MAHFFHAHFGVADIERYVILIGPGINGDLLIPVVWSLILEMRVSLLFPLLLLAMKRPQWIMQLAVLAAFVVAGWRFPLLSYIPFFLLGILLAANLQSIRRFGRAVPWQLRALTALAALWLYGDSRRYLPTRLIQDEACGIASAVIIVLVLTSDRAGRILSGSFCSWLGDVSYSFYLIHFSILLFVVSWLYPLSHSLIACWTGALALAWGIAYLMHRFIETPGRRHGRTVARKLSARLAR